ncbi:MAG: hypothetical protein PVF46_03365, partial [Lysobacterales bacterium]
PNLISRHPGPNLISRHPGLDPGSISSNLEQVATGYSLCEFPDDGDCCEFRVKPGMAVCGNLPLFQKHRIAGEYHPWDFCKVNAR